MSSTGPTDSKTERHSPYQTHCSHLGILVSCSSAHTFHKAKQSLQWLPWYRYCLTTAATTLIVITVVPHFCTEYGVAHALQFPVCTTSLLPTVGNQKDRISADLERHDVHTKFRQNPSDANLWRDMTSSVYTE
jgi:hypothetical protein